MKKALLSARESMQENLRTLLDGLPVEAVDRACQIIVVGIAPLLTEKPVTRALLVKQIGTAGYRVTRTTNLLDVPVGSMLSTEQTKAMHAEGINVSVMRNS